jgi:CRP/FNR family transcriptional regulator, cyclic AMP receptor protein
MGELVLGLIGMLGQVTKMISAYTKNIVDLRIFSIISSFFSAIFNGLTGSWPNFLQSCLELPVHAWRLYKTRKAMREIERAEDPSYALTIIRNFTTKRSFAKGETIFLKGGKADTAYIIETGSVHVVEPDVFLESGALFGEMGLFADQNLRNATTVARQDVVLSEIAYANFESLYRKNPEIGFALMRLIAKRFSTIKTPLTRPLS